jgi:predicted CXXCH cytochrome family protein
MKNIAFRFAIIATTIILISFVMAGDENKIPEYVGSQTCQPCHSEIYKSWRSSDHANMLVPIGNPTDLPLEIAKASIDLQKKLEKADFMVAGTLFISKDPSTGHYRFLGVAYDGEANTYKPSDLNLDWTAECAGCHTTNMDARNLKWSENGIGCEACHGPGGDHVAGMGDPDKIISSKDADICGQCHGGNDRQTGGNLMSDGSKWVVGFRPGMNLADLPGLQLTPVDPERLPPDPVANHLRIYNMWKASGHSKALSRVIGNSRESADCYGCHSAEGFAARRQGEKVDITEKGSFTTLTCVTCHNSHNSQYPYQLVMEPQELCNACHTQEAVLKGKGAKGIEDTRSFHSAVECVSCHMSEGNHLMKVIRPDDPDLPESRTDACTACHRDNNRDARARQLQDWHAFYKESMDPLQAYLKTIDSALKENPDLLNAELKAKLDDVRSNLSIIIMDGSEGAHNLDYALEIMAQAARDLKKVRAAMK